ncbi:cell wall-associated NlpC family hydrolase [Paenarthrobacter nicotinovorans]|uniref:Cell wall-associated NlpC family hydrolase n=2 Tax=Paenarthrobacter nicotinovorans TaxID=29320 RepID=A0ABT9TMU8_PAENI|nr:cell wall-associated NlpC family hydrolase [Paenarthrobacter nicotinovorans]
MPHPALAMALVRRRTLVRAATAVVLVIVLSLGVVVGAVALALAGDESESPVGCVSNSGAVTQSVLENSGSRPDGETVGLSAGQIAVAKGYISVGKQLRVPREAMVIAIMMSLQESTLRMLANANVPASFQFPHDGVGSDHDSVGSAQQRPAAGWGTVAELMDLSYNARAFYGGPSGPNQGSPRGLLDIPGWSAMSKGQAAQAVQVSAFPELYARWEPQATAIVDLLQGVTTVPKCSAGESSRPDLVSPEGLSQIRQDILRFTQAGLGGAYVWGGTAFKAWDCSGFVQWIYRQVGIELPRVEQWRVGIITDTPQIGDLVVQNPQGPYNWGHVGIYAGDGMMYSALNPSAGTLLHPIDWNPGTAYFDLLF